MKTGEKQGISQFRVLLQLSDNTDLFFTFAYVQVKMSYSMRSYSIREIVFYAESALCLSKITERAIHSHGYGNVLFLEPLRPAIGKRTVRK